jgi:hypothetical protein
VATLARQAQVEIWAGIKTLFIRECSSLTNGDATVWIDKLDLVWRIIFAGLVVSFSSLMLLYIYQSGDTTLTAIGILGAAFSWYTAIDRLPSGNAFFTGLHTFSYMALCTVLIPVLLCVFGMGMNASWGLFFALRYVIPFAMGLLIGLDIVRGVIDVITNAFMKLAESSPKEPWYQNYKPFNKDENVALGIYRILIAAITALAIVIIVTCPILFVYTVVMKDLAGILTSVILIGLFIAVFKLGRAKKEQLKTILESRPQT